MARDDFSKITRETLGKRVGYRCSNPNCNKLTVGAHKDPYKAADIGVAAHITAAAEGGPRYDPLLTPKQRSDISNGIWLCQNCAKLIDSNPDQYPVKLLKDWKEAKEKETIDSLEKLDYLPNQIHIDTDLIFDLKIKRNRGIIKDRDNILAADASNKLICSWTITWEYTLKIYNNSKEPIYNLSLGEIDDIKVQVYPLPAVNNLKPLDNTETKILIEKYFIGTSTEADNMLRPNLPEEYVGTKINLRYLDSNRNEKTEIIALEKVNFI